VGPAEPGSAAVPATESGAGEIIDAPEVPRDRRVSLLTVRDLKVIARSGRRSSDSTVGMSPLFHESMERKRAEARSLAECGQSHEDQTDVVTEEVNVAGVVTEETVVASTVAGSLPLSVQELATATYEIRDFLESANVAATEDVAPASAEELSAFNDEPAVDSRLVMATFASNDEPAVEAPAAAVAANDESPTEPEAPTAATEPQPVAAAQPTAAPPVAAQPVDEDLLERRRKRDAQLILSAQRRRRRTRGF